jgi:hypothetical protein
MVNKSGIAEPLACDVDNCDLIPDMDGNFYIPPLHQERWTDVARYSDYASVWTNRGSNSGGGEIFHTLPGWPCSAPSLLYNGYRVFPGDKAAGA